MELNGIRVLDLTRLVPGPYASQLLADLGAEVIKVEEPKRGDYARDISPKKDGVGIIFRALNRGKKSVSIDLSQDRGREILYRMVEDTDVFIEGNRPGVAEKLQIDYDTLTEYNSSLVYCSLSGYGQDGPYRDRPGHDLNYSSYTGLMDMTRSDEDGRPALTGFPISDMAGGLMAAFRICGALAGRGMNNQEGTYLDVSLTEACLSFSQPVSVLALAGKNPRPRKSAFTGKYPCYDVYECKEGEYVSLAALEQKFWKSFCRTVGKEDLIEHHLSDDPDTREFVRSELQELFSGKSREEWVQDLEGEGVMVSGVRTPGEAVNDPHFQFRNVFQNQESRVGLPDVEGASEEPPEKGEHTRELLTRAGFEFDELQTLSKEGIIS